MVRKMIRERIPERKDRIMSETMKLAVPSMGEGGLEAERSGHFGHCDCFTIVDIVDGEIKETSMEEKSTGSPISSGVTYRMLVFSIQTTRSSCLNFQSSWPLPTSMA